MRMSFAPSSASALASSTTASSPKAEPAMNAMCLATASWSPIRVPHWTRSFDHSRAIFSAHLASAAVIAGSDSRPRLRVSSAIFRPSPSAPIRFATGTRTPSSRVTPFSMPRRPMKALRCSTTTPGQSHSTTKAEMPPGCPSDSGTRAMMTARSAMVPLVVHSFTPSRT